MTRLSRRSFLYASVAAALAGCDRFVGGVDNDSATLRGYLSPAQRDGLQGITERFETTRDVRFEASYADAADINEQLRVQLTSGTAADLFRVSPGYSSPVAAQILGADGEVASFAGEDWVDDVPRAAAQLCTVKGEVMAFPVSTQAIANIYNTKVFADAGVDVPTTWPDLLDACDRIKATGITPIALGLTGGIAIQFTTYALAACLVYTKDPDIDRRMLEGEATFSSTPAWREALERFVSLDELGYTTPKALGVSSEQATRAVATGDAGMTTTVVVNVPQLAEYAPGGPEDIGVFAFPGGDDADSTLVPIAPEFIAVNAESQNVELAKSFVNFLAQPENVTLYAEALDVLPGLDVADGPTSRSLAPLAPFITDGSTVGFANYLWPNAEIQQVLLQAGQRLYAREISVDQLLEQMDAALAKGRP